MEKTELLLAGVKYFLSPWDVSFSLYIIHSTQHVRLLEIDISANLSLQNHVTNISKTCFHHLHQLQHIWFSLTVESVTLVPHFMTYQSAMSVKRGSPCL